jgi:DNA repair protein Rad10
MSGRGVGGGGTGTTGNPPRFDTNNNSTNAHRTLSGVNAGPLGATHHAGHLAAHPPPANCVLVSRSQNGNAVLRHIKNVRWVFVDQMVPDFVLGPSTCAIFVSLRYHLLHPTYLGLRVHELQRSFRLCVVLCLVDAEDVVKPMCEVNKVAAMGDCTLLCAWWGNIHLIFKPTCRQHVFYLSCFSTPQQP